MATPSAGGAHPRHRDERQGPDPRSLCGIFRTVAYRRVVPLRRFATEHSCSMTRSATSRSSATRCPTFPIPSVRACRASHASVRDEGRQDRSRNRLRDVARGGRRMPSLHTAGHARDRIHSAGRSAEARVMLQLLATLNEETTMMLADTTLAERRRIEDGTSGSFSSMHAPITAGRQACRCRACRDLRNPQIRPHQQNTQPIRLTFLRTRPPRRVSGRTLAGKRRQDDAAPVTPSLPTISLSRASAKTFPHNPNAKAVRSSRR